MTLYNAVEQFLNLIIPITNNSTWWCDFRTISIIVITYIFMFMSFILPFIRLVRWGIFGGSKKNKWLNRK